MRASQPGPAAPDAGGEEVDIARLAHELRTPLGAIAAMAEVIRDERLGPLPNDRYRGYASDIHDSVDHALQVLASALQRPVANSTAPLVPQPIIPDRVLAKLASSLETLAQRNGITLTSSLAAPDTILNIDERALRQIVLNLVSNAFRFTPPGGIVSLTTRSAGTTLTITVADTGDGMDEANLARVQASTSVQGPQRLGAGSRIGLSIVRALVNVSGGNLSIASVRGQGTTVEVRWPLAESAPRPDPQQPRR